MTKTTDVLSMVQLADPVTDADTAQWASSAPARAILADVLTTSTTPGPAPRRTRRRSHIVAAAAVLIGGTTATAFATGILGGPAPDRVKQHLADLDRGMPADLRYNPDLEHARAVAATASGAIYLADTSDGGYCLEVVSGVDRPRGAVCVAGADLADHPLDVTAPIPDSDTSPLLVGGRANASAITGIEARYADGAVVDVPFGSDSSWLLEVADAQRSSALADGLTVVGVDDDGATIARRVVPPLRDDDPTGTRHDADEPVVSTTVSDGADLTLVLGVEGQVNAPGPTRLTLRYPDGTAMRVPMADDGSFRFLLPAERRDDFGTRPGSLVVTRHGEPVATTPVASVAFWRSRAS